VGSFDPTCPLCADWNTPHATSDCPRCGVVAAEAVLQWQAVQRRTQSLVAAAQALKLPYDTTLDAYSRWLAAPREAEPHAGS
jgi:hypothetical protein